MKIIKLRAIYVVLVKHYMYVYVYIYNFIKYKILKCLSSYETVIICGV